MLDFLRDAGISNMTINKMSEIYPESVLFNLSNNDMDCLNIIGYLRSIGIYNIDNLLIERIDLFMTSYERIKDLIKNCQEDNLIGLVNEDANEIDVIFN